MGLTTSATWWRVAGWPSTDEWQALAGVLGVIVASVAIGFTLWQLRLSREANQLAASAAERAAKAAEDEARPYVSVSLALQAIAPADPTATPDTGLVYVQAASIGRVPARNVTFKVDPPFETSGRGKPAGSTDPVQKTLDTVFGGSFEIGMLGTGPALSYLLDFASNAMDPNSARPKRYAVTASYSSPDLTATYSEVSLLDLSALGVTIIEIDPLETIARQLRRLNEKGLS